MVVPLILTRPIDQSTEFWGQVAAACPGRFKPVLSPLLEIRAETSEIDLDRVQGLLFTSRNAVQEFARITDRRDIPALCVGGRTAAVAREIGLSAQSADGDAAALAALAAASYTPDAGHYLHLRGAHGAGDLAGALLAEGVEVDEIIIYYQVLTTLSEDAVSAMERNSAVVPLFSPRTAAAFADQIRDHAHEPCAYVAISANTAAELDGLPRASLTIAATPDADAMLAALAAL